MSLRGNNGIVFVGDHVEKSIGECQHILVVIILLKVSYDHVINVTIIVLLYFKLWFMKGY